MKRTRSQIETNRALAIRRRKYRKITGLSPVTMYGPARVQYSGSMVPMRTGGYRPNRVERKVSDITTATYQVNTTGSITLLAVPVLGSDFNQRIGRKILLKSVYIRGFVATEPALAPTAATSAAAQQVRMMIVSDMQPNGSAPAITDILVAATASSQLNLNNRDRFRIITDKTYVLGPYNNVTTATQATQIASGAQIINIKKYKKLNLEMIFNATNGGTIADIASGALFMVWIGSTAASGNDANAIVSTRVRYADA